MCFVVFSSFLTYIKRIEFDTLYVLLVHSVSSVIRAVSVVVVVCVDGVVTSGLQILAGGLPNPTKIFFKSISWNHPVSANSRSGQEPFCE